MYNWGGVYLQRSMQKQCVTKQYNMDANQKISEGKTD